MSKNKLFFLAAAAIVKDESSYIEEWLCYHYLLGFEHFYIFDNGSTDEIAAALRPYINAGLVTCITWPLFPGQVDAYSYATRVFGVHCEWLALFDIDEFFVLRRDETLPDVLRDLRNADQLLVFWRFFGHSGHITRPAGLVIENYTQCDPALAPICKCVIRPDKVRQVFVHNCTTVTENTVNDAGERLKEEWYHQGNQAAGQRVVINHYFTRSYEEYSQKIARGQVDGRSEKQLQPYEKWNYQSEDKQILRLADKTRGLIQKFRDDPLNPFRYGGLTQIGAISSPRNFVLFSQEVASEISTRLAPTSANGPLVSTQRYVFGTACLLSDDPRGHELASWVDNNALSWARLTQARLIGTFGPGSREHYEIRNSENITSNAESTTTGRQFLALTDDPQIVLPLEGRTCGGYFWLSFVVSVPAATYIDFFATGVDLHGSETMQVRRIHSAGSGVVCGLVMINDAPLSLKSIRMDPGSIAGEYRLFRIAAFHCA